MSQYCMNRSDGYRQNRSCNRLSHPCHRSRLQRPVCRLCRTGRTALPVGGRSHRSPRHQIICCHRLSADRRAGICAGRTGAGRAVFYPHEPTAQEKNHADHLQPWLLPMVVFFEKRPPDRGPDRSVDGKQPCDQHEKLRQLETQARSGELT